MNLVKTSSHSYVHLIANILTFKAVVVIGLKNISSGACTIITSWCISTSVRTIAIIGKTLINICNNNNVCNNIIMYIIIITSLANMVKIEAHLYKTD